LENAYQQKKEDEDKVRIAVLAHVQKKVMSEVDVTTQAQQQARELGAASGTQGARVHKQVEHQERDDVVGSKGGGAGVCWVWGGRGAQMDGCGGRDDLMRRDGVKGRDDVRGHDDMEHDDMFCLSPIRLKDAVDISSPSASCGPQTWDCSESLLVTPGS